MTPQKLNTANQEQLIGFVNELQDKLKKKSEDLTRTREQLGRARVRIRKLKGIVSYQRERILQLHR